jgi:hypothetical protein
MQKIGTKMMGGMVGAILSLTLLAGNGYSQSQPASKATAQVGLINVMDERSVSTNSTSSTDGTWVNILRNNLKTANQKDVLVNVSLETGLLTDTLTKSKNGTTDTSSSTAGIEVRVLVDGVEALPGKVVFGRRTQTLSATFQGLIDGCLVVDPLTGSVVIDPNCVTPEQLQLVLETMNANSFSFVVPNLSAGTHTIQAQARISLGVSAQDGSARARALIGHGSLTAEEVRMIRNEDIELP